MTFYEEMAETAFNLLSRYGRNITIFRKTVGEYDPVTKDITGETSGEHDAPGVLVNYSNSEIDGTIIKQGDRLCILAAQGLDVLPATSDKVYIDETLYSIESVTPVKPASEELVYFIQVRR